jgi:hypothetical protein
MRLRHPTRRRFTIARTLVSMVVFTSIAVATTVVQPQAAVANNNGAWGEDETYVDFTFYNGSANFKADVSWILFALFDPTDLNIYATGSFYPWADMWFMEGYNGTGRQGRAVHHSAVLERQSNCVRPAHGVLRPERRRGVLQHLWQAPLARLPRRGVTPSHWNTATNREAPTRLRQSRACVTTLLDSHSGPCIGTTSITSTRSTRRMP